MKHWKLAASILAILASFTVAGFYGVRMGEKESALKHEALQEFTSPEAMDLTGKTLNPHLGVYLSKEQLAELWLDGWHNGAIAQATTTWAKKPYYKVEVIDGNVTLYRPMWSYSDNNEHALKEEAKQKAIDAEDKKKGVIR